MEQIKKKMATLKANCEAAEEREEAALAALKNKNAELEEVNAVGEMQ